MIPSPLFELTRWMVEMPPAFRMQPDGFPDGRIAVAAVVADLVDSLLGQDPAADFLAAFAPADLGRVESNRLRWVLATAHLLWHPAFRAAPVSSQALERLLVQDLSVLAAVVSVQLLDQDEDRREELIRITLRALGQSLPDESAAEADDRFRQVDSCERRRVLLDAAARERRAREVREAIAAKAAQEAAAKVSRE